MRVALGPITDGEQRYVYICVRVRVWIWKILVKSNTG